MNETKSRILDAAERLIAEFGLDVSLRTITAEARVNLAAVNYHFQSKDALWEALVARRFEPMNAKRIASLNALEAEFPAGPLPLERVLEAFLGPVLDMGVEQPEHIRPMMGRLFTLPEEFLRRIFNRHFAPIASRFNAAFARAVPEIPDDERIWRLVFAIGSMVHVMNWSKLMPLLTPGPPDPVLLKRRIITFAAAGFRAPAVQIEGEKL
jgi:AcrR family transcriptional regulator